MLLTPVPRVVQVSVTFPRGLITEWYPQARSTGPTVDWGTVRLTPPADEALIDDHTPSHYYPARAVASATVTVGDEQERFLFYRGIGDLPLTLHPILGTDGHLRLAADHALDRVLVFERHGDAVGFTVAPATGNVPRPVLDDSVPAVRATLRGQLVDAGLYGPEADAMLATWDGDWFEDGLRVLYLVPRAETDAVLPLTVSPKPDTLVRVLVGPIEVPTPEALTTLAALLDGRETDDRVLALATAQFGRFVEPWLRRSNDPRAARLVASIKADGTRVD